MLLNRDELLLLSRGGRVPPATRAGPRPRIPPPEITEARESLRTSRGRAPWRGLVASGIRRVLHRREHRGPVGRRSPHTEGYADPDSYPELEFAVGFVAEEEMSK